MRIFPEEDERALYELELARDWRRTGLITQGQLDAAEEAIGPVRARTGTAVRALLFGLAVVVQAAVVVLAGFELHSVQGAGMFMIFFSIPCYGAGEFCVRRFGLYRFGFEEALVAGAVVNLSAGVELAFGGLGGGRVEAFHFFCPAALASVWVYLRFGYLYAVFSAILGVAGVFYGFDIPESAARSGLAALFAALYGLSFARSRPDHERTDWEAVQAALLLAAYLSLNLRLNSLAGFDGFAGGRERGSFYWMTFAAAWIIPSAGLIWGIRLRNRGTMAVAAVGALLTLMTWKPYLGLARRAWDPAVLGAFLMGGAAALARWLDAGRGGTRAGFTARPLLLRRDEGLAAGGLLAAAASGAGQAAGTGELLDARFEGKGGSSGGAGAGGEF